VGKNSDLLLEKTTGRGRNGTLEQLLYIEQSPRSSWEDERKKIHECSSKWKPKVSKWRPKATEDGALEKRRKKYNLMTPLSFRMSVS
jgi:hypothetical protein